MPAQSRAATLRRAARRRVGTGISGTGISGSRLAGSGAAGRLRAIARGTRPHRREAGRLAAWMGLPAMLSLLLVGISTCTRTPGIASSCGDTTSIPGLTKNEIRLGLVLPDSGVLAPGYRAVRAGVDARIGAVNAAGGINGRRISYTWRDDVGTAQGNLIAARDLVNGQGVFGLLEFTSAAAGSAPFLASRGIPVVGSATEDVWLRSPNMFGIVNSVGGAVDTYGRAVVARGGTRAYVVRTGMSSGVAGAADRIGQSLRAVGVDVVGDTPYLAGADNVSALAAQIVDSGADTVITMLASAALPALLDAIHQAGGEPDVVLALGGYDHDLLRTGATALAGTLVPISYRPFETGGPATERYLDAMRRYAPQLSDPRQEGSLVSYIDTDLFLRGLRAAGPCPTRASFVTALRSMTSYTADGLLGPTNVGTARAHPTTCVALLRVNATATAFDSEDRGLCGAELTPTL
ncbi:ABC transporter substrate-binding protein [Frankia sp. Ag45/Mut15]|uniref:ABC transporter substrate-binding protein n=1 Tax=Frankia umida TaxID=573489 RepID=A0ABT0K536_9ACTN|nr:ABC transporter substrate-binding protein [Frankia umida]MCK9878878.1 ABC transporter substrate-binding protein [Frankia umida]